MLFASEFRRADAARREMKGLPPVSDEPTSGYPSEDDYVAGAMRLGGVSEEKARADYRAALAEDAKHGPPA